MKRRAVDLSLEELAAMGANAALKAAQEAERAGLIVTGTVDFLEDGQATSALAERDPSGVVTLRDVGAANLDPAEKSGATSTATRHNPTD